MNKRSCLHRAILLAVLVLAAVMPSAALAGRLDFGGVLATSGNHDVGAVVLQIDDDGGYSAGVETGWETMLWPQGPGSKDQLWGAHFAVGNSATRMMSGNAGDWTTTAGGALAFTEPGVVSDEDGYAQYNDAGDPTPLGLLVTQRSCAWAKHPYNDFVLVAYVIRNVGAGSLSGLYAGHWVDFDVNETVGNDRTAYDGGRRLAYNYDDTGSTTHVGLRYFTPAVNSYNHELFTGSSPTEAQMYNNFSNGQFDGLSGVQDQTFYLGTGAFSLAPGQELVLGTAWIAGDSLSDLQANADSALAIWQATNGCGTLQPGGEPFVPEGTSVLLLGTGLVGLAGYATLRWRKAR